MPDARGGEAWRPVAGPAPGPPTAGVALVEVLLCSGYPTQILLGGLLRLAGLAPIEAAGRMSPTFVVALSLADTAVLLALVLFCLRRHGERPRAVFLGRRSPLREAALGVILLPFLLAGVLGLLAGLRTRYPWLHNVPDNPLAALVVDSPGALAVVLVTVLVAGGLREELQRAFLLHRFEQRLGGAVVGLLATSVAFGLGHTLQGWDAAITIGALGLVWGLIYLARRSAVAPIVSHALFNAAELIRAFLTR